MFKFYRIDFFLKRKKKDYNSLPKYGDFRLVIE